MTHAKSDATGLRGVSEQWDAFLASEAAQNIADVFGYPASTITRRNEKDSRLQSYPFSDGLIIVRHYRREAPWLCQKVTGFLNQTEQVTQVLSIAERAADTMDRSTEVLSELLPLARHDPVSDAGRSRVRRKLAELIRTATKLLNEIDAEAARRSA